MWIEILLLLMHYICDMGIISISSCLHCREYYHVLFSNLRVMIHGGNIFEEYFGPNGFK